MAQGFQIAPGVDGYMAARQMMNQEDSQKMGVLMQLAQLQRQQQQDALAAEERPLKRQLLESQIAENTAQAGARRSATEAATRQEGALSRLAGLQSGDPTMWGGSRPTAVINDEAAARQAAIDADARGESFNIGVPSPTTMNSLLMQADPKGYVQERTKAQFREPRATGAPVKVPDPRSPTGFRWVTREDAIGMSAPTPGENGVTVNNYPNAPLLPGKTASNKIDEGLLDVGMRLQGLSAIEKQFKPEYQQIGTRLGQAWTAGLDKMGVNLPEADKRQLTEFSQYKRNSIDSLNQYIKSITGAAMSEAEAERILKGLPNPGSGLMDGDSPIEFKAKLDDAIKQSRMAEARFVYMKRNGMALGDIPLDRMPSLMNQRGGEIEATIKRLQPNMPESDLRRLVRRNLSQEFGLAE